MHPLHIGSDGSFAEIFHPIASDFEPLYWLASFQGGPWEFNWRWSGPGESTPLDDYLLQFPSIENTSIAAWRPGTLPQHIEKLADFDEWSWLLGFPATPETVNSIVDALVVEDWSSPSFLDRIDALNGLLIVQPVCGHWDVYSARPRWHDALAAHPAAQLVDRREWLTGYRS